MTDYELIVLVIMIVTWRFPFITETPKGKARAAIQR